MYLANASPLLSAISCAASKNSGSRLTLVLHPDILTDLFSIRDLRICCSRS
jgi:hypothetical protein